MTLVDASVLLDVIEGEPGWYDWSEQQLVDARDRGPLFINAVVYAEIARDFTSQREVRDFLADLVIELDAIDENMAFLAARAHAQYRQAGGQRTATLPDFFIGAHASVRRLPLLTRDSRRLRTYFPDVTILCPEA
ncbi:PIN domain-containing protein [Ramlibacter sp. H39-3-26]|uniref:type II toxin-antitoxin system VapC family toxin n=1 Tax=Curvibacter soli TaxID=3031331 RepID=UPI0023DA19B0|nr:PIN domain-containing protein [Ramlibacter sp. H39-3-26]MDF1484287.1 PIN domain-containing protein [Ramlibacter sp. H39-3-26]